ncbi:VCBS repeat-containing protein [Streptomyces glaucosporus]|uniref:VCBS repeat-containing protein n=1 Tax=Streptomyces glaucosporus TaxID=284044 RepID=A0ABN3IHB5_9ACTN
MRPATPRRRALAALLATAAAGALLAGCGRNGADGAGDGGGAPTAHATGPFLSPGPSRPVPRGEGSEDPDDVNGDGHRDLLLPVFSGRDGAHRRVVVVYGSAKGPDPATRTVHGRRDLGLPAPVPYGGEGDPDHLDAGAVLSADLDGDGFPELVSSVDRRPPGGADDYATEPTVWVSWGGPRGPRHGAPATRIEAADGLEGTVRGDFDGDGHHDLAALRRDHPQVVLLYGPFTRAGVPARTGALPGVRGRLAADAIDPTGKPRATALLVHDGDDGEQTAATLHPARPGSGPAREGVRLRRGNAVAFGDFDGDGTRDVAIGDDGSRNDEPGHETEAPEVDGSLAIHPGDGGAPRTYRIPRSGNPYGSGGYLAADPDGDGRDALVVGTDDGALLIDPGAGGDGGRRTEVSRTAPARTDGRKVAGDARAARPYGAGDFDGDGRDELVLGWGASRLFDLYGELPTHWWIADGASARDLVAFSTVPRAPAR